MPDIQYPNRAPGQQGTSVPGSKAFRRTNITLLTGHPKNGKSTWLFSMLNERKKKKIKERLRRIARSSRENEWRQYCDQFRGQYTIEEFPFTALRRAFMKQYTYDPETDPERAAFLEFLEEHPDSELGYQCHVISLEKIEKQLAAEDEAPDQEQGEIPEKEEHPTGRQAAIRRMAEEIMAEVAPPDQVLKRNLEGEPILTVPAVPRNLYVDADLTVSERKQLLNDIRVFARRHFVPVWFSCCVFQNGPYSELEGQDLEIEHGYANPSPLEEWNDITYRGSDGQVRSYTVYREALM